jgi:hypothetical protein
LAPLAAKAGIALLDTKGYVVQYAKELSFYAQKTGGHLAMISDFDADSFLMSFDVFAKVSQDIYRIGIDYDTIGELTEMYPEHSEELNIDTLKESYKPGTSLKRLNKLKDSQYLMLYSIKQQKSYLDDLEYLKEFRIEIDSVQRAIGYRKLWTFIVKKLEKRFPERNYNRAIETPRVREVFPDIYLELQKLLIDRMNTLG